MEAKELRISNFVWVNGKITTVESIDGSGINIEACGGYYVGDASMEHEAYFEKWGSNQSQVEPIPLTEEWLLRFGAKKLESDILQYGIGFNHNGEDYIDVLVISQDSNKRWYVVFPGKQLFFPYVHTLQNFVFTNYCQELTIKT